MTDYRLADVPLFAALAPEVCRKLEQLSSVRQVPRGTVLAVEGEPLERLFVVHSGRVAAYRHSESGRQAHIRTDEAPVVVDKATAIAGDCHLFTWTVLADAVVRNLPREVFGELLRTEASVALQAARHLATQANQARDDYLTAATDSTQARVLQRLQLLSDPAGAVRLPDGQAGLADELGLTRVTVSRALHQLIDEGRISMRGRTIRLT